MSIDMISIVTNIKRMVRVCLLVLWVLFTLWAIHHSR